MLTITMTLCSTPSQRLQRFAQVSSALALLSDAQLAARVEGAQALGCGIGGSTLRFEIAGSWVFAKRVRLTDLERRPEHRFSTANLFGLPAFCHRNVGSPGLGAWRELAVHQMVNAAVFAGQLQAVPLMYHWRELPGASAANAAPLPAELSDVAAMSAYWHEPPEGGPMAARLRALNEASASLLIVMEHLPYTLSDWLHQQCAKGPQALRAAQSLMTRCWQHELPKLQALGLLHGDAHHGNLLTDGQDIFFADFGLALSSRFDLTPQEQAYLHTHASLDAAYLRCKWVMFLLKTHLPANTPLAERLNLLEALTHGRLARDLLPTLPDEVADCVQALAPLALRTQRFFQALHESSRALPYPKDEIESLLCREGSNMHSIKAQP